MTSEQVREFLSAGTRTGKLATVRPDGRPHVAPVWFVLDGPDLVFMTGADTVKGRNLRRDPRVSFAVDDDRPPYSFVLVSGTAEVHEAAPDLLHWSSLIARRYVEPAQVDAYARRNAVPGELLVRLHPESVVAVAELAD